MHVDQTENNPHRLKIVDSVRRPATMGAGSLVDRGTEKATMRTMQDRLHTRPRGAFAAPAALLLIIRGNRGSA